jgi:hypothetical protein
MICLRKLGLAYFTCLYCVQSQCLQDYWMPSVARTLLLCCGNPTKHINRLRGWQNVGFSNVKVGGTYGNQSALKG